MASVSSGKMLLFEENAPTGFLLTYSIDIVSCSPHYMHYLLFPSFLVVKLLLLETTLSLGPYLVAFRRQTVILQAMPIR